MAEKLTKEELLAKAKKPAEDAMRLHPFYSRRAALQPGNGKQENNSSIHGI